MRYENSFFKSVMIPFFCGILGSVLVIGVCFGIPSVREKILTAKDTNPTSANTQTPNLSQVSLVDYSNTAIGVAEKVRPCIVGIKVTFNVNSIFSRQSGTGEAEGSRNHYQ